MSLREDMWKYELITGESAEHVPIIKLGAFLDGYEMGSKALKQQPCEDYISREEVLKLIDYINFRNFKSYENLIAKINDLPSVTPSYNSIKTELKPCEDCISRKYIESIVEELENICINGDEHILSLLSDIKNVPSVQPKIEVLEDCISRKAVTKAIEDDYQEAEAGRASSGYLTGLANAAFLIHNLPSIKPQSTFYPPQTCEDCISRKDTIEWLKKVTVTEGIEFKTGFEQILYDIEQMPSVNPEGENFTDEEKRIFLASVAREMRVCEQIDSEKTKVKLVPIIQRVKDKVLRSSLWEEVEE